MVMEYANNETDIGMKRTGAGNVQAAHSSQNKSDAL